MGTLESLKMILRNIYLAGIDADTDAGFDTLTNKNIKYLF